MTLEKKKCLQVQFIETNIKYTETGVILLRGIGGERDSVSSLYTRIKISTFYTVSSSSNSVWESQSENWFIPREVAPCFAYKQMNPPEV